eukprot:COSAG03_NODE_36_length_17658_cov_56.766900_7_plen_233_part_00
MTEARPAQCRAWTGQQSTRQGTFVIGEGVSLIMLEDCIVACTGIYSLQAPDEQRGLPDDEIARRRPSSSATGRRWPSPLLNNHTTLFRSYLSSAFRHHGPALCPGYFFGMHPTYGGSAARRQRFAMARPNEDEFGRIRRGGQSMSSLPFVIGEGVSLIMLEDCIVACTGIYSLQAPDEQRGLPDDEIARRRPSSSATGRRWPSPPLNNHTTLFRSYLSSAFPAHPHPSQVYV